MLSCKSADVQYGDTLILVIIIFESMGDFVAVVENRRWNTNKVPSRIFLMINRGEKILCQYLFN